jgi:VanZ family protein
MEPAAFYPMMIATLVVCLAAWAPFDVTLEVGNLKTKLHAVRADPWQLANDGFEGIEFIRYVLFAVAATSWLRQLGTRAPAALGAVAGMAMAFGLEASQFAIESRVPGLEDALVHSMGALVGAALVIQAPRRVSAASWFVVLVLTTVMAGLFGIARSTEIPGTATAALGPALVRRIVERLLMYFPIGFALPVVLTRGRRWYATAAILAVAMSLSTSGLSALQDENVRHDLSLVPFQPLLPFLPVPPFVADAALATAGALAGVWVGGPGWVLFRSRYWHRASKSAEIWSSPVPRDYRPGETKIGY